MLHRVLPTPRLQIEDDDLQRLDLLDDDALGNEACRRFDAADEPMQDVAYLRCLLLEEFRRAARLRLDDLVSVN